MCGICGAVGVERRSEDLVRGMLARLSHRGPDASGVWSDGRVALGHTRLSILDLSEAGSQPMSSPTGRWSVTYNGEIFNHEEIRAELNGVTFRGHSDTETLVAALEAFGVVGTLHRLVGMFAIAAWDRHEQKLYLARDRAGQKPLFYGFHQAHFVFGSELGVLEAFSARPELDLESLALMLRYNSIPAPRTVYAGIKKLPPSSYLIYDTASGVVGDPVAYWNLPSQPCPLNEEGVRHETLRLLEQSVRLRMLSDVPLGAFLSGGIDSSLVVSVMQKVSTSPVRTFTIDFDDHRFSEAAQARAVAQHLGTRHTEMKVTPKEAQEILPTLGALCDEPFGDSSLVPTLLLSKLTRQHVTVALTGDGGDELFGGYHRHIWLPRIHQTLRWVPEFFRRWIGEALSSARLRDPLLLGISRLKIPLRMPEEKLDKLANIVRIGGDLEALYRSSLSHVRYPEAFFSDPIRGWVPEMQGAGGGSTAFDHLCRADFTFYMPNDVLVKVDRASMRHGLEARSPFLDHRLVEFAFTLDQQHKIKGTRGKMLLRSLLEDFLPVELLNQPKMGFAVPIGSWMRNELRPWVEDLLASSWLANGGLLRPEPVRALWNEHLGGKDRHNELWNVLMLLSWLEARSSIRALTER